MVQKLTAAFVAVFFILVAVPASAAPVNTNSAGIAIKGYDAVAYHTLGQPTRGHAQFTHRWNDATWRFASAEHRDLFAANPERYAPAYGGYCAYAIAFGSKANVDPTAWKIVDGTLYLNLSHSIKRRWERKQSHYISRADAKWPQLANS